MFIFAAVLFLLLFNGNIHLTVKKPGMNVYGMMNNISWLCMSAMLALVPGILLGWSLILKKSD